MGRYIYDTFKTCLISIYSFLQKYIRKSEYLSILQSLSRAYNDNLGAGMGFGVEPRTSILQLGNKLAMVSDLSRVPQAANEQEFWSPDI